MSICYNKSRKRYFICYDLKLPDGTFKTISIYNKEWTKERGKKFVQAIEAEEIEKDKRKRKMFMHFGDNISLNELLEKYKNSVYLEFGEQTAYAKIGGLNKYLLSIVAGYKELDNVFTIQTIEKYKENIISRNLTPKRTNDLLRYLKELLIFASDREYITFELCRKLCNLLKSVSNKNTLNEKLKYWTPEEWDKFFMSFSDDDKWRLYFEVTYKAALRIGESLALTWDHFYPDRNILFIEYSMQNNGKLSKTKNSSSTATVTLPKALTQKLLKFKEDYCASEEDFIFFANGKSSKNTVRRIMKKHIDDCGVSAISPHGLRHSCASRMINMGLSPLIVSKHLRHSSVKETLDTYSHIFPNETVGIIDEIFK